MLFYSLLLWGILVRISLFLEAQPLHQSTPVLSTALGLRENFVIWILPSFQLATQQMHRWPILIVDIKPKKNYFYEHFAMQQSFVGNFRNIIVVIKKIYSISKKFFFKLYLFCSPSLKVRISEPPWWINCVSSVDCCR